MIADLKPYPQYRDTRLNWLDSVPAHWTIRRIKTVLQEVDSRSSTGLETLLSLRMHAGLVDHHAYGGKRIPPTALVGYKRVLPGEIVMNRMRASLGLFAEATSDGLVSPDYAVFRQIGELSVAYAIQLFRSPAMAAVFRLESTGLGTGESGFLRLYSDQFGRLAIPIPPPDEQAAIVRFLDWANTRLERAIRAKRKVIALLNEQKQAIIHRAVTRGVNPSVPLKPSGIPWLGDIPQHWDVRRLAQAVCIQTGFPFESSGFVTSGGTRLLRGINVTPDAVRWDAVVYWHRGSNDGLDEFALNSGDIVLGMDRPVIASGVRAAMIQEEDTPALLLQRVARLRPAEELDATFLLFLLRGRLFRDYVAPIFTGISVPHLSPEQIRSFRVPLPSVQEQKAIVNQLQVKTRKLESIACRLESEIELLREYRARLVSDVVTGKLDVRKAAAGLPDEALRKVPEEDNDLIGETDIADEEEAIS